MRRKTKMRQCLRGITRTRAEQDLQGSARTRTDYILYTKEDCQQNNFPLNLLFFFTSKSDPNCFDAKNSH